VRSQRVKLAAYDKFFHAAGVGFILERGAAITDVRDRLMYFRDSALDLKRRVEQQRHFIIPPVGVREFIESPTYLNRPGVLWPKVMREVERINSGKVAEVVATGSIGSAKALALDTELPTPTGWTTMGAVKTGDVLLDEQGHPCRVVMAHPVLHQQECREVVFDDGTKIVADAGHLWLAWSPSQRANKTRPKVVTTDGLRPVNGLRFSIELTKPLVLPDAVGLGVDPYVLGVWLGDGSSDGNRVWSADPQVVLEVSRYYHVTEQKRPSALSAWTIHGISPTLRRYGLYGNKHIPAVFLRASYEQRLALLQGLMDTDGTASRRQKNCSLVSVNNRLADDVAALVTTLGLKPRVTTGTANLYGKNCGPYWKVSFSPPVGFLPFMLKRKLDVLVERSACLSRIGSALQRYVVSVRKTKPVPVRCVTVDSPSKLYLASRAMVPTHNTTVAVYSLVYQLYVMSCYRNLHSLFDMDSASEIIIVFQSITKDLAKDVDYTRFKELVDHAPYFQNVFRYNHDIISELQFPNRIVVKPVSSAESGAIGQNVIGGLIDEMNFMQYIERSRRNRGEAGKYDQAQELYNAIARRRKSRFMRMGYVPGLLFLVSSSRYAGQFTDRKKTEALTDSTIFVYDKRVWDICPPGRYSGDMFRVFVGDAFRKPRILKDHDAVPDQDANLVIEVPVEHRLEFEKDLIDAIRDIGGVSSSVVNPFILDRDKVRACFGTAQPIVSRDDVDFVTTLLKIYPLRLKNKEKPRFAHVDLGLTGDSAGLAMGYVDRFIRVQRSSGMFEVLPFIVFDIILEVRPPPSSEVPFDRIRGLLYKLRDLGLNVRWCTFDAYQSADSIQMLAQRGVITGEQSMDTSTAPYDLAKAAFYDGRVVAPMHEKAYREWTELQRDERKGKIDHPQHGSKDLSDAMAGVIYGLTRRREIWLAHGIMPRDIPESVMREAEAARKRSVDAPRRVVSADGIVLEVTSVQQ
jgi:hypothetical protein